VSVDGTQQIQVRLREILAFLPDLVPALQEAAPLPLCIDNPSVEYQKAALRHYDRSKAGRSILNSIAASRERLDEMIDLVAEHDTLVIVMVLEQFSEDGSAQCLDPGDVHRAAKVFVEMLATRAGRTNDQIIIDPGVAPVGATRTGS
jgi:5-methyltetrahydrofolate--homocysteine methyltransferase